MAQRTIKFSPPDIGQAEIDEVVDTLRSGWITTGPKTKEFERRIAAFCGTSKAVCLNSATAGLELILRILDIGEGDEVITSAYTYTASASVIEHVGARIVLCDTSAQSFEMDYEKLPALITEKTKAIIAVDYGGRMCDYDVLCNIVESARSKFRPSNKLQEAFGRPILIADAAHSLGAVRRGQKSGSVADFSSFSFHAVKNLTTAEGGAVTWRDIPGVDNDELYNDFMLWSLHGQSKDALAKNKPGAWEYDIKLCGQKCNMTDIMAAIGLAQLNRYDALLARRREIIGKYDAAIRGVLADVLVHYGDDFASSGHLYATRVYGIDEKQRNAIITAMAEMGVATNVHYKPLPMHTAYKNLGFDIKDFPVSYGKYANEITLPLHTLLGDDDVEYVTECFRKAVKEIRKLARSKKSLPTLPKSAKRRSKKTRSPRSAPKTARRMRDLPPRSMTSILTH